MQATRILFIGLDSADPRLLTQWAEQGWLPSLASLFGKSARAKGDIPAGFGTRAMWISLYCGVSPGKHGRYFGRQARNHAYKVEKFEPPEEAQEPIWSAASRQGKRVAVIDVPIAPVCRELNGMQIKDWCTHDPVFPELRTCPAALAEEVTARFGVDPVGPCDALKQEPAAFRAFRDRLVERVGKKAELACHYLDRGGWDLFMVGFSDPHCVGHQCWHLHDSGHALHDPAYRQAYGDPIRDVYVALDKAIGELLQKVGPDTTVIFFSGTGMGPNYSGNHLLDEALRRLEGASQTLTRKAVESIKQIYRQALPVSVRVWLGPLGDRVDESSLVTDRARRRYFAVPHNEVSGAVRLNVIGREPSGRVHRGAEFESIRETLWSELLELVDPDTGKSVVSDVLKPAELFGGAHLDRLPDLLVVWNRERPITAIASPRIGEVRGVTMTRRTGDHRPDGILCVRDPHIAPRKLRDAVSVERIAPTIASLLGIDLPEADGRPIADFTAPA